MANHLRICIVGGRNFGKTHLVKNGVRRIPKFQPLNYKNDNEKKDSQTAWSDVKDREFMFGDKILSFVDYAGEYFEQWVESEYTSQQGTHGETDTREDKIEKFFSKILFKILPHDDNHKKDKRKISRCFNRPDGVVILLPADFSDVRYEDKRIMYGERVREYVKGLLPGTPIQIIISKWDLHETVDNPNEFVKKEPFATCLGWILQGYRDLNYKEYQAGFLPISIPKDSEIPPVNVLELFEKLSEEADKVRNERLKTEWGNANWFKRTFVLLWKSWGVHWKNTAEKEIGKIFWKSWGCFCGAAAIILAVIAASIVVSLACREMKSLDTFEKEHLDSSLAKIAALTPEKLSEFDDYLNTPVWVRRLWILRDKLSGMERKLANIKGQYVGFLEGDLEKKLEDDRVRRMSPWQIKPEENLERARKRSTLIADNLKRLPRDRESAKMSGLQAEAEQFIKSLQEDQTFDTALLAIRDLDKTKRCREMDRIRKDFAKKQNSRKRDFERLDTEIKRQEFELSGELEQKIEAEEKRHPAEDWKARRDRTEAVVKVIESALESFVEDGETYRKYQQRIGKLRAVVANEELYGPFDIAYKSVKAAGREEILHRIVTFRKEYPTEKYPERAEEYQKLTDVETNLTQTILLEAEHFAKGHPDNPDADMESRIQTAKSRIEKYEREQKLLPRDGKAYDELEKKIVHQKTWISEHEKYCGYDQHWNTVVNKPETEQVQAISVFLRNHQKENYPEYADRLKAAEDKARMLSEGLVKECTETIEQNRNRNVVAWWQTRKTVSR